MKFTIYLTDELHEQVQAAMAEGLNASAVCQDALRHALGIEPDPAIEWDGYTEIGRVSGGTVLVVHDGHAACRLVLPRDKILDHEEWHDRLDDGLYGGDS
jgi:hypothetical protein